MTGPMKSFLDMLIENESQLSDDYIREEVDLILFAVTSADVAGSFDCN